MLVIGIIALISIAPSFGGNIFDVNHQSPITGDGYYEPIKNIYNILSDKLHIGDSGSSLESNENVNGDFVSVSAATKKVSKKTAKKKVKAAKKSTKKVAKKKVAKKTTKKVKSATLDSDDESNLGTAGLVKLQKYMNKNLNHASGGSHTAAGVEKTGLGDCWGLAEWAAKKLAKQGYTTRIVQGASSSSSRHRWVQVKIDGKWVNFESSLVTKRYGSKPYYRTCAKVSKVIKYL
jgi:hypothetical protein